MIKSLLFLEVRSNMIIYQEGSLAGLGCFDPARYEDITRLSEGLPSDSRWEAPVIDSRDATQTVMSQPKCVDLESSNFRNADCSRTLFFSKTLAWLGKHAINPCIYYLPNRIKRCISEAAA